jgi:hypothetical protein
MTISKNIARVVWLFFVTYFGRGFSNDSLKHIMDGMLPSQVTDRAVVISDVAGLTLIVEGGITPCRGIRFKWHISSRK